MNPTESTPALPLAGSNAYSVTSYVPGADTSSVPSKLFTAFPGASVTVPAACPSRFTIAFTSYLAASHNPPGVVGQPHIITTFATSGTFAFPPSRAITSCARGAAIFTANPGISTMSPSPVTFLPGMSQVWTVAFAVDWR